MLGLGFSCSFCHGWRFDCFGTTRSRAVGVAGDYNKNINCYKNTSNNNSNHKNYINTNNKLCP